MADPTIASASASTGERPRVPSARGLSSAESQLRVPGSRRQTLTPEPWGIHSVPGMLSDFQRHVDSEKNTMTSSDDESGGSYLMGSIPAFISLPTSLLATEHLVTRVNSSSAAIGMVSGTALLMTGLAIQLGNRTSVSSNWAVERNSTLFLVFGIVSLMISCTILGSVRTTMAVICSLNLPTDTFSVLTFLPYAVFGLAMFVVDSASHTATQSLIGYLALILTCYCLTFQSLTVSPSLTCFAGVTLIIPGIIVARPGLDLLTLLTITSGAVGVFLLSKRDLVPTRWNTGVGTLVSLLFSYLLYEMTPANIVLGILSVLIPVERKKTHSGVYSVNNDSPSESKRSILDSILAHADTRNIFYFLLLNFSFMLIQLLYSVLSHSLGLLSDSIHMFFDCLALLVGLVASILSKFPASTRFPYGLGKVETVSGFTNGCLLIGISGGIIVEAIERITHPVELEKTKELLVVSFLGLVVNIVGIFAFNHGHGDGGHGHSHGGHSHGHSHSHGGHSHSHGGGGHSNENMHGIFLHIVADTLGSVGVVISTLLTNYFGWSGFDPLASILIAVLIFASSIPLITSSAKTLLLSLDDNQDYLLRDILNDVSITSGVAGYTVPKFWQADEKIRGTLHVQYQDGVNSTVVRDKVESRFKKDGIDNVFIQMENENSSCWCRKKK